MEVWDEGEDDGVGLYGLVWYGIFSFIFFSFSFFLFSSFLCIRLMGLVGNVAMREREREGGREGEEEREREARASREPPCILLSSVIYLSLSISIVSTTDYDQHIYSVNYRLRSRHFLPFLHRFLFPILPSIPPSITLTPSTPYTPPPPS